MRVSFTVPAEGLPEDLVQLKVKARTGRIRFLGEGHGVIVRIARGPSETFRLSSWLTDSKWVPLSDPLYADTYQMVTRAKSLEVASTNLGGFYYNVLVVTTAPIDELVVTIDPPHPGFALWGANATHAYVGEVDVTDPAQEAGLPLGHALTYTIHDIPAGTMVFLTVHMRYALAALPSATYLPRVYSFSCSAVGDGQEASASASVTAVKKK